MTAYNLLNKLLFLSIAILAGCECVPSIVSPEIKEPTEFANVKFINSVPDCDSVNVWESDREVLTNLNFDSATADYKKISSGLPNIRLANAKDSSIFYNAILDFVKDNKYTLVAYGSRRRYNVLLLNDKISDYNQSNAYIRFINTSPDSPALKFVISSYPINPVLTFKSFTNYSAIPIGSYNLSIVDIATNSELLNLKNLEFKQGSTYTLVLKGFVQTGKSKKLQCVVVEGKN